MSGDSAFDWKAAEIDLMGGIDSSTPHSARVWNYWLGGKDNYPIDQKVGEDVRGVFPEIIDIALQSRYFLARVVRRLADEAGIRQFIDLGAGLPAVDNTHEVAQRVAPESRVVYVDNDPVVIAHARALLTCCPPGVTAHVCADVRDPDVIIQAAERTLDFAQPIALLLLYVLGHITNDDEAQLIITRLLDTVPPGSFLVVNDGAEVIDSARCNDVHSRAHAEAARRHNASDAAVYRLRGPERIAAFFNGLQLAEPGVVPCSRWRPDLSPLGVPPHVDGFCGVGRK